MYDKGDIKNELFIINAKFEPKHTIKNKNMLSFTSRYLSKSSH